MMGPTVWSTYWQGRLYAWVTLAWPVGSGRVALARHEAGALQPQLHPGVGVDGVVNTPVAGIKAPQQLGICRVDNGPAGQGGDVPLPQVEALFHRSQLGKAGDALAPCLLLEVRVLHRQKLNLYPGAVGALFQQLLDEVELPLFLCHGEPSLQAAVIYAAWLSHSLL